MDVIPTPEPSVLHDLPVGAKVEKEDEEGGETGDMAEAERQLSLESGRILTAAATFCCGGPDGEYEHRSRMEQQSCLDKQLLGITKPFVLKALLYLA